MFGIGGFEFIIILIFGFLLVGDRLPDVAKTLTRALRTFQSAQRDMNEVIRNDVFDPNADEPFKDPLAALDKMGDVAKRAGTSLADDFKEVAAQAKKKPGEAAAVPKSAEIESAEETAAPATEAPKAAESFAERRARYERERAARLAAEAEAAAAAQSESNGKEGEEN